MARIWGCPSRLRRETGAQHARDSSPWLGLRALSFSADSRLLISVSYDDTARVWDLSNWEELLRLEGHTDDVMSGAFVPDGSGMLTASRDGSVGIWRISFDSAAIRSWIASERYLRELTCAERAQYGMEPCA
ncbi:MAG: hypothetical protein IH587_02520 [Anaerolineae bacterium]|nr:hypothetical protein [Anaerolineae bacterium]